MVNLIISPTPNKVTSLTVTEDMCRGFYESVTICLLWLVNVGSGEAGSRDGSGMIPV